MRDKAKAGESDRPRGGGDFRGEVPIEDGGLEEASARLRWYLLTNGDTKQWGSPWFQEMVRDLRVVMDGYGIATDNTGADAEAGAP